MSTYTGMTLYYYYVINFYKPPWWRRGRAFASHAGDRGSIPGRDGPKSLKQVVTAPLSNAWH